MAIIRPFCALRPPIHLAPRVASLPYDVMDVEEARQMASGNADSFLHVSRPEIDLSPAIDPHADEVHERGRQNLENFQATRVLNKEVVPCYYIYRQRMGVIVQTGLVACASVDDYQSGVIKKHEHTRAVKEHDPGVRTPRRLCSFYVGHFAYRERCRADDPYRPGQYRQRDGQNQVHVHADHLILT